MNYDEQLSKWQKRGDVTGPAVPACYYVWRSLARCSAACICISAHALASETLLRTTKLIDHTRRERDGDYLPSVTRLNNAWARHAHVVPLHTHRFLCS
jgi:hypothetical protein